MKQIYLDYAATTPLDPSVRRAMEPFLATHFGNPSSLHRFGQAALRAIDEARTVIANSLEVTFREIVFTSGATEANNLAIRGAVKHALAYKKKGPLKIITSAIEHESVLETCRDLEPDTIEIAIIPVNREGFIDLEKLKASLDDQTVLVSVMYANNEIGTVQPLKEISDAIQIFKSKHSPPQSPYPLFHADAAQAFNYLDCRPTNLGVDLLTLSAHKIYGPKGMGTLYLKHDPKKNWLPVTATTTGGGQERNLRSGTENVAAIVGFAEAVKVTISGQFKETARIRKLRDYLWKRLRMIVPELILHGPLENRLPNNLSIGWPGVKGEELLIYLDLNGIAASSGSACNVRAAEPSHVLQALGYSAEKAREGLRISLGRLTTKAEIDKLCGMVLKLKNKWKIS